MRPKLLHSASRGSTARQPGKPSHAQRRQSSRLGFTLIELLVSMAITLIMVYAIAEFYAYVGKSVADGRGVIEMGGQLRGVSLRLRQDLNNLTLSEINPPVDATKAAGYFEIVEYHRLDNNGNPYPGATDADPEATGATGAVNFTQDANANLLPDMIEGPSGASSLIGDGDDILAMTVQSKGEPFVGRFYTAAGGYQTASSNLAEIIWFTGFNDTNTNGTWDRNETRFLVRRVLLILPALQANLSVPNAGDFFFQHNDISAHRTNAGWALNSLADLTNPENRFLHANNAAAANGLQAGNLPNLCQLQPFNGNLAGSTNCYQMFAFSGDQGTENVMVQNLLAFDVRVWDPLAPIVSNDLLGSIGLTPSDVGFATAANANNTVLGRGAYVDLGYGRKILQGTPGLAGWMTANNRLNYGLFGDFGNISPTGLAAGNRAATYDTWTMSYERDGLDQFGDGVGDTANDGLDNDGANGVDDPGERETQAPYPFALRGIQVRIRLYEPGTRQTRQATVAMDFLQE